MLEDVWCWRHWGSAAGAMVGAARDALCYKRSIDHNEYFTAYAMMLTSPLRAVTTRWHNELFSPEIWKVTQHESVCRARYQCCRPKRPPVTPEYWQCEPPYSLMAGVYHSIRNSSMAELSAKLQTRFDCMKIFIHPICHLRRFLHHA